MSEENKSEEENDPKVDKIESIPRRNDDELREIVNGMLDGRIFTSAQADEEMISSVFLPLMFGGATAMEDVIDEVGVLFEYTEEALPRSINGHPIFPSYQILHKEDWEIVLDSYQTEKRRRDTTPIDRSSEKEEEEQQEE